MDIRLHFLLSFTLLFSISTYSQKEIKASVIDSITSEPVSFATVRFKDSNRGIVADFNGNFRLPFIEKENLPKLLVTALGYKSIDIDPVLLSDTSVNIIKMSPQSESLEVVIINHSNKNNEDRVKLDNIIKEKRKLLAKEIVWRAIRNIPNNLDQKFHSYIGYYRDYQFADSRYYNLNEAILRQYDQGILKQDRLGEPSQQALYSFNLNDKYKKDSTYSIKYDGSNKFIQNAQIEGFGGNELSILNIHNPIRNYDINTFSYVYQMNKDFPYIHRFSKSRIYFVDDDPVIDIKFITDKRASKFQPRFSNTPNFVAYRNNVEGTITISLKDYSIYRLDYKMFDNVDTNPLFNINIEYKKQDGKMYLNYISFNNRFTVEDDSKTFKESSVFYNREIEAFDIKFKQEIDKSTVSSKNFRIRYNGKRVVIKKEIPYNSRTILVYIIAPEFNKGTKNVFKKDMKGFDFKIKKLKDINVRVIYKKTKTVAYQFREFFVQEVVKGKDTKTSVKVISKMTPLKLAPINELKDTEAYIINSPLREATNEDDKN